jgi:hypothetical protein
MEVLTGQRDMDVGPLLEYFEPLHNWLKHQNEGYDVTWDDKCPPGSFAPPPPSGSGSASAALLSTAELRPLVFVRQLMVFAMLGRERMYRLMGMVCC